MSYNIHRTTIQHRASVILPPKGNGVEVSVEKIVAFARNLEALGYTLSKSLFVQIQDAHSDSFDRWATDVIGAIKELKGANYSYEPMYPNFPAQVAEADAVELYLNAITHYFGDLVGLRIMPKYDKIARPELVLDPSNFTALGAVNYGAKEDFLSELFKSFISSTIALSAAVKKDVRAIAAELIHIPVMTKIPNKENMAIYVSIIRSDADALRGALSAGSNPIDILRILATFGDSDPSLADGVKLGKLTRPERRMVLEALNGFSQDKLFPAFARYPKLWKHLGAVLHVGEYATRYANAYEAFDRLRNGKIVDEFNSTVEKAIKDRDVKKAVQLLETRPTLLIRRLYELLTVFKDDSDIVLNGVASVGHKASSQALAQAYARFVGHGGKNLPRLVFSRSVSAAPFVAPAAKSLDEAMVSATAHLLRDALKRNYATKPSLGKVYLAPRKGSHAVPFGFRAASDAFKLLGRGSRLPFNTEETLRFFIHWKDIEGGDYGSRVDIDLSAAVLTEDLQMLDRVSYYNLQAYGGTHSGDITSAPNGAEEFIDINPQKILKANSKARYIMMTVISYTGQSYAEIPEALAGFMTRANADKGEIFDARTVENVFKLNSASRQSVPFLFDLVTGEAIWLDLAMSGESACRNVDNTAGATANVLAATLARTFVDVETLLEIHAEARATEMVATPEEADTVLGYINGESTLTFDEIIAEWV